MMQRNNFDWVRAFKELYQPLQAGSQTATAEWGALVDRMVSSGVPNKDVRSGESRKLMHLDRRKPEPKRRPGRRPCCASLSRRQKAQNGLLKCPKAGWQHEQLDGMRALWRAYASDLVAQAGDPQALSRADFHGAQVVVVRSVHPALVGLRGTVVLDSRNTFSVVSPDNKCRIVGKKECIFEVDTGDMTLTIVGKYLCTKTADRNTKKIKKPIVLDL